MVPVLEPIGQPEHGCPLSTTCDMHSWRYGLVRVCSTRGAAHADHRMWLLHANIVCACVKKLLSLAACEQYCLVNMTQQYAIVPARVRACCRDGAPTHTSGPPTVMSPRLPPDQRPGPHLTYSGGSSSISFSRLSYIRPRSSCGTCSTAVRQHVERAVALQAHHQVKMQIGAFAESRPGQHARTQLCPASPGPPRALRYSPRQSLQKYI